MYKSSDNSFPIAVRTVRTIGAWDYLKWKNVKLKFNDKGELLAAELLVYEDEGEEYFTFITPEAYHALMDYMDFRGLWREDN